METIPHFEYDPAKSQVNLAKHGIDFETAKTIWRDQARLRIDARSVTEPRYAMVGKIDGKMWTVFATDRTNAVRIISARRARVGEVKAYDSEGYDG